MYATNCMEDTYISVICPVYHGAAYLEDLIGKLARERSRINENYPSMHLREVIFVNDNAIDNSRAIILRLKKEHDWIQLIDLSNNFGQHAATIAGLLHSSGDWIFTIDEDLQHDPVHFIPMLRTCLEASQDVCYAVPRHGAHGSFLRDKVSVWFKRCMSVLLQNKGIRSFYSYRLIRGSLGRAAAAVAGPGTYLDMALLWFTSRLVRYEADIIDHRYRNDGRSSGYGIWSLLRHAKRLIFSSNLPFLRFGILFGLLLFLLSASIGTFVLLVHVTGAELGGLFKHLTTEKTLSIFFAGVVLLFLGFLIEICAQLMLHSKGKPTYFVVDRERDLQLKQTLSEEK